MIAIFGAWSRGFWRDRAGVALTLALPALVYLLFAAIFGAGARGEVAPNVGTLAGSGPGQAALVQALDRVAGKPPTVFASVAELDLAVVEGQVDVGVLLGPSAAGQPLVTVVSPSGGGPVAARMRAGLEPVAASLAGVAPPRSRVASRTVGPTGNLQSVYYAGAVSVMFVFFAAMHGALGGLDERRSGLQARLVLAGGGLSQVLAGRIAWLTAVGVMQTSVVFAAAWSRLPPVSVQQIMAGLITAVLIALTASSMALALVAACRAREQAQPLTTFVALVSAAIGGSMAPRFLMPDVFRTAGLATPHAWAIESYQRLFWLGEIDTRVALGWAVLACMSAAGALLAWLLERRRVL